MTSVPKPLKFLRPHFDSLKEVHEKIKEPKTKVKNIFIDSDFLGYIPEGLKYCSLLVFKFVNRKLIFLSIYLDSYTFP